MEHGPMAVDMMEIALQDMTSVNHLNFIPTQEIYQIGEPGDKP